MTDEWIDAEKVLPKKNKRILICATPMYEDSFVDTGEYFRDDFYINGRSVRVSHWMPLPRLPDAK